MRVFLARHHEGLSAEKLLANISVSMLSELLGALRTRTGKRGVSVYATAAVRPSRRWTASPRSWLPAKPSSNR